MRKPILLTVLALGICLAAGAPWAADRALQKYPDVLAVQVQARAASTFDFDASVSSPYDTPQH